MKTIVKTLSFILLYGFAQVSLLGQSTSSTEIDSLKAIAPSLSDSLRSDMYKEISVAYEWTNLDSAMLYARKGYSLGLAINNIYLQANLLNRLGVVSYDQNKLDSAEIFHVLALNLSVEGGITKMMAHAYNGLGNVYSKKGNFQASINNYFNAIPFYEQTSDTTMLAGSYANVAIGLRKIKEPKKALEYQQKALSLYTVQGNETYMALTRINIGAVLNDLKEYQQSLDNSSLAKAGLETLGYDSYVAYPLSNMAIAYDSLGKTSLAESNYLEAIKIHTENKRPYELAFLYNALANFYYKQGQFRKAVETGKLAISYASENDALEFESSSAKTLAHSYEKLNQHRRAYQFLKSHVVLNDSLFKSDKAYAIFDVQTKYETEKKEKEILIQRAELAEQRLKIERKNITIIAVAMLGFLLAIGGYLIYNQQKLKNRQLEKEHELRSALLKVEGQNRLQEQRLRISRDLHDNIGSQLTFIISSIDNLKYTVKNADKQFTDRLTSINFFTRNTINQLRDTIWAMNKDAIRFEDLIDRINNHITQAGHLVGTRITFKNEIDDAIEFSALVGINVFRIVQEAINNAIKYADAELIAVEIKLIEDGYELTIQDNGKGFDIENSNQGNGIRNMIQRSEEIDGKLIIDSKINHGTTITLLIDHAQDLKDV